MDSKEMAFQFVVGSGALVPVFALTCNESWLLAAIHGVSVTACFVLGGAASRAIRGYFQRKRSL